jgi:UTP--glucose-1-phosphate uridylyltransferase
MTETALRQELQGLPDSLRTRLANAGFDGEKLIELAAPLFAPAGSEQGVDVDARNRVQGRVDSPAPQDIQEAPRPGMAGFDRLEALGVDSINRGELAFCVLAGGMATRMGGVVKALVEAIDGRTFLDLRLSENRAWSKGRRPVPLWLMTSEATEAPIREALARANAPSHVATFTQNLSLRLTKEGSLFRDESGQPSTYAPGHGDLPDALRRSGLLSAFVAQGGKYVWIANLDNLGASVDPVLLGHFIASGSLLRVEVTPKQAGDRGGIPVWAEVTWEGETRRRLQVLEEFRLPRGFDASSVPVFNTNTFLMGAPTLLGTRTQKGWFLVEKKVGSRVAVQFERLLQEATSVVDATYVRVPRDGAASRFLPVKDFDELHRRQTEIRAVAQARGML